MGRWRVFSAREIDDIVLPSVVSRGLTSYLGSDEHVLHATRQHPFALIGAARRVGGLLLPLVVATWGFAGIAALDGRVRDLLMTVLFISMLLLVLRMAWRVLEWEFERVVITDEKLVHVRGVFARRIASTPLAKVSELVVRQPFTGRLFGFGSLVVDGPGGGGTPLHGLKYVPDPTGVYRLVSDQARRGRAREGGGTIRGGERPGTGAGDAPTIEHTVAEVAQERNEHPVDDWPVDLPPQLGPYPVTGSRSRVTDHTIEMPPVTPEMHSPVPDREPDADEPRRSADE